MPLSSTIVHRRGWVLLAALLACAILLPKARSVEARLDVAARVYGSQSDSVHAVLARRFKSPFARTVLLVVTGVPSPAVPAGESALRTIVDSVGGTRGVSRTLSFLDQRESIFLAPDGAPGTFVLVGLTPEAKPEVTLDSLRGVTKRLEAAMKATSPNATLQWTGEIALNTDLRRASAADVQSAESRALPATLILLVIAFGALAAAFLPVLGALLAIGITLGIAAFITHVWPLSILLQNVVTMLGLGLGIDYSLLTVSRFREERAAGRNNTDAAINAARSAGPTVALSGLAVAIGFGALTIAPVNELRSVAVGGLLIVGASVAVATLLLPGLLAMLGRFVDLGRIPFAPRRSHTRWLKWGQLVAKYPVRILLIGGLPVCALALQARRLNVDLPRGDWLPPKMESAQALHALNAMGHGAVVQTLRVIIELPDSATALNDAGWAATERLAKVIAGDAAVAETRSLPALIAPLSALFPRAALLDRVPKEAMRAFVSGDQRAALIEVVAKEGVAQTDLNAFARRLRALDPAAATGLRGARLLVGGLPAFNVDYQDAVAGRFFQIIAIIVGATFVVLAIGLRSILVPIKALALNLLAVAGAFGAVTLVFQDGHGASLLGMSAPLDGVFPAIPVLVFCTVFGLSMDYEVFLVARVREARRAGLSERDAIAEGLARTGGVITSAAAIMVVVFGAFTLGDFLLIKMLGFGLAVAVLLDATVMRLALSPALLALAGKWNWWPGERAVRSSLGSVHKGAPALVSGHPE